MRRCITAVLVSVGGMVFASAVEAHSLTTDYLRAYRQVAREQGVRAPGRNIVRHGLPDGHKPTRTQLAASLAVLRRMLTPPAAPANTITPVIHPDPTAVSSSPGGLTAIARCESGGNPRAISPGGRYRGKYQFDQATWQSVGGRGDPAAAAESEQDQRAATLYRERGGAPWPVCGAAR